MPPIITLLASCLCARSGFGFSLVFVPALLLLYDAHTTVVLNIIMSFIMSCVLAWRERQNVLRELVRNLFLASLLGLPPGLLLFKLSCSLLMSLMCLTYLSMLFYLWKGQKHKLFYTLIAGFLCGSIGIPGPPIVLLLGYRDIPKDNFRATTLAYFVFINAATLLLMLVSKPVSTLTLWQVLSLVPFVLGGQRLGSFLFNKVPREHFKKGIPVLIIVMSTCSLISVLINYY